MGPSTPKTADAGSRFLRVLLAFVVVPVVVGVLVVAVLVATPWGNDKVRNVLVSQANKRMRGELSIGSLRGSLLSSAALRDVRLLDSAKAPLFTAKQVKINYALLPLLHGQVVVHSLVLDTAVILLDQRPGARWNFQSLTAPKPQDTSRHSPPPELSDITIHHGRFLYRRQWRPDSTLAPAARDSAIAKALEPNARKRTERVAGGFQRVLDYHDIDAHIPAVRIATGAPTAVEIGSLAMLAEPYRPPAIDVRSLVGTLYASNDSLWWRGARMRLPNSNVSGDGKIGFHRSGLLLDLTGSPVATADLRWLNPALADGGGAVHFVMHFVGDTARFAVSDVNLRYDNATVKGHASVASVTHPHAKSELLVDGADLTIAALKTSTLHALAPNLPMRRAGVIDGHIVASGSARAINLDADVGFNDDAAGRSRVVARGGVALTGGFRASDLHVSVLPLQIATLRGSGVKTPLGGTVTGQATVNGSQSSGWTVNGNVVHTDRGEESRVSGSGSYQPHGNQLSADLALAPLSLVTVGRYAPSAELRGSVAGTVRARGTLRNLALSAKLKSRTGGALTADGTVSLPGGGAPPRYDIIAVADALNANAFSRRAPRTLVTGTVMARGTGTSPASANATISADLAHSAYDTFAVERLHARARVAGGLLQLDTLDVLERGARVRASGTFGLVSSRRGDLQFALDVDTLGALRKWIGTSDSAVVEVASGRQGARMAAARADSTRRARMLRIEQLALGLPEGVQLAPDTLSPIRRDSLAGSLHVAGTLSGNVKELGVDAVLRGSKLVARGSAVQELLATVKTTDVRDASHPLNFALNADTVQTFGMSFQTVHASGVWVDKKLDARVRVRQDSLTSYALSGRYSHPASGIHDITLDSLNARFDTLTWRLAHRAGAHIAPGEVRVDSVDLRSSAGARLFADGFAPASGPIRVNALATGVHLETVLRALQRDIPADAVLGLSLAATGTRASPVMTGSFTARSGYYRDFRTPDVDADLRYVNRRLVADATARDSTGRRVLALTSALPLDLALASVPSRKVDGPLVADLVLDSLSLAALPVPTYQVEEVHGKVAGNAHVRGDWAKPLYSGAIALRDAGLTLPASSTGMRIERAVADIRIAGDSVVLDSLVAFSRGEMRASGSVSLADRAHPFVRLVADGQDLRVFDSPRGLVDANVHVAAVGPLDSVRVTGQGEMLRGFLALKQFRKDLLRVKAPGELSFFTVFDTSTSPTELLRQQKARAEHRRFAVIADLSLVVDPVGYYRNRPDANTGFFTGDGELVHVHVDQRSSDMWEVGFVRVQEGVAFFRTRAFIPARGTLTFTPHTGSPAMVEQVGQRIVWEPGRGFLPLQFLTGGTSSAPAVGLESGTLFPIRGRELNGYLTMGRLSLSLIQQSGSSLSGGEAWSGQLSGETGALAHRQQGATALGVVLHDIGTGATKEFGLDAFSVSPSDVPTELVFGKTGGVRGALIEGGRYITPDLYLAGQLHFTSGIPGFRVEKKFGTTYRMDLGIEPRFLFRPPEELGITHPTVRTGAFGLFMTRLWNY